MLNKRTLAIPNLTKEEKELGENGKQELLIGKKKE